MPRRQTNKSEPSEPSWQSPKGDQKVENSDTKKGRNKAGKQAQAVPHKISKHSLDSLDPMRSIRSLHVQQCRNHGENEVTGQDGNSAGLGVNPPSQEHNLISFTPPHGCVALQGASGKQNEPKKQRTPRKRKTNQRQEQN